jgi:hypothetical protein
MFFGILKSSNNALSSFIASRSLSKSSHFSKNNYKRVRRAKEMRVPQKQTCCIRVLDTTHRSIMPSQNILLIRAENKPEIIMSSKL